VPEPYAVKVARTVLRGRKLPGGATHKMRLRLFHTAFTLMFVLALHGQSKSIDQGIDSLRSQISLEIFGNGIKYSIGYERLLTNWPQFNIASQIGIGYYPFNDHTFSIPFEITTFWGSDRDFVETGLGLTWCRYRKRLFPGASLFSSEDEYSSNIKVSQLLYSFRFGFRYQKPNGRSSFRAALIFLFESSEGKVSLFYPQVPIGISYGYRF